MNHSPIITSNTYKGYPILPWYKYKTKGYIQDILDSLIDQFEYMFNRHSQVLILRFDVRFPVELCTIDDNSCIVTFMEELIRYYRNQKNLQNRENRKNYDPHYLWVREKNSSHNHHYHVVLFMNGNAIRYFKDLGKLRETWARILNRYCGYAGDASKLIYPPKGNVLGVLTRRGINVYRDDTYMINEMFEVCTYLAKVNTKEILRHVKIYGASQVPNLTNNKKG